MTKPDNTGLTLPETFNIENVKQYHEMFAELLSSSETSELVLDLSPITSIDTAGMQLLITLQQECGRHNLALNLCNPGDKFLEAARMLGTEGVLTLSQASA